MASNSSARVQRTTAAAIRVSDVMSNDLVIVDSEDIISKAVNFLLNRSVGSVLVMDKEHRLVGIITKGDILREVLSKRLDPEIVKAREVMSQPVIKIKADATVEDASRLMIEKKISKLAVMKDAKLAGIITSTDIIRTQPVEVGYLEELIRARFFPRDLLRQC
jgi:CBS domain-containing protein